MNFRAKIGNRKISFARLERHSKTSASPDTVSLKASQDSIHLIDQYRQEAARTARP